MITELDLDEDFAVAHGLVEYSLLVDVRGTPGYYWPGNYWNPPESEATEVTSVLVLDGPDEGKQLLPILANDVIQDLADRLDEDAFLVRHDNYGDDE